jgi:hypothetical protein
MVGVFMAECLHLLNQAIRQVWVAGCRCRGFAQMSGAAENSSRRAEAALDFRRTDAGLAQRPY